MATTRVLVDAEQDMKRQTYTQNLPPLHPPILPTDQNHLIAIPPLHLDPPFHLSPSPLPHLKLSPLSLLRIQHIKTLQQPPIPTIPNPHPPIRRRTDQRTPRRRLADFPTEHGGPDEVFGDTADTEVVCPNVPVQAC